MAHQMEGHSIPYMVRQVAHELAMLRNLIPEDYHRTTVERFAEMFETELRYFNKEKFFKDSNMHRRPGEGMVAKIHVTPMKDTPVPPMPIGRTDLRGTPWA